MQGVREKVEMLVEDVAGMGRKVEELAGGMDIKANELTKVN